MPIMLDPTHPIAQLVKKDRRYKVDAYAFIFESLRYAQESLGMGKETASEPLPDPDPAAASDVERPPERHVSGQELCEAVRRLALEQYGYMAKTVLNSWGLQSTGDFGEIVFNLIDIGQMRKTPTDRREDFNDVYDFDAALRQDFKIEP